MTNRWLTTKQAAEYLQCSEDNIRKMSRLGYISKHKVPCLYPRYDALELDAYLSAYATVKIAQNQGVESKNSLKNWLGR